MGWTNDILRGAERVNNEDKWYNGLVRGAAYNGLNYLNLVAPESTSRDIQATLRGMEKITEENKAKGRTAERQAKIDKLNEESANAKGILDKTVVGAKKIADNLVNAKEWQVGEFIGENLDFVNLIPGGKSIKAAIALGAATNAAQSAAFNLRRDDKSAEDKIVEAALGGLGGGLVGGVVGAATRPRRVSPSENSVAETSVSSDSTPATKTGKLKNIDESGYEKSVFSSDDFVRKTAPAESNQASVGDIISKAPENIIDDLQTQRAKALGKTKEELDASHPLEVKKLDETSGNDFVKNDNVLTQALKIDKDKTPAWASDTFEQMQQHPAYSEVRRGGGDIGIFDASKMSDYEVIKLFDASKNLKGDVNAYTVFDNTIPETLANEASTAFGKDISGAKFAVRVDELIKNQKHPEFDSYQTANQLRNSLDGFKFDGIKDGKLSFSRDFGDAKVFVGFDYMPKQNLLTLKTLYSDTGILPTALVKPRASNSLMSTQGSLPAKEILSKSKTNVNGSSAFVIKGMFEKLGDKYIIRLFSGSDITTIFHETAHYFERTFTPSEKAIFDTVFGKYADGVERSEAFADGFVRWVADRKYGTPELSSIFQKFADFIKDVFRSFPDSPDAKFDLSPEMKLFYRAMLGDEKAQNKLQTALEKNAVSASPAPLLIDDGVRYQAKSAPTAHTEQILLGARRQNGYFNDVVTVVSNYTAGKDKYGRLKDDQWAFTRYLRYKLIYNANKNEKTIDALSEYRLNTASDEHYAKQIFKTLRDVPKSKSETLHAVLSGDKHIDELPKELIPLYNNIRSWIDSNADKLIRLGEMLPNEKIEHYLTRTYKKDIDEANSLATAIFHGGNSGANLKIRRGKSTTLHVGESDIPSIGETLHNKKDGQTWVVDSVNELKNTPGKYEVTLRRDYTYDERTAMGEVRNSAFAVYYTLQKQSEQIRRAELISKIPTRTFEDEADAAAVGYVLVPDEPQKSTRYKRYGQLSGKYVTKATLSDIDYVLNISEAFGVASESVRALSAIKWGAEQMKLGDTVKNVSTHLYNVLANIAITFLNDPAALLRLFDPKNLERARQLGLVDGELLDISGLQRLEGETTPTGVTNAILRGITGGVKNFLLTKDSKLGQGARWLYSLEDSVFKGAVLAQKLKEGMSEADAIRYIADNYVDYTKPLPPAIRFLDNHGVTPFLGFAFRSAPVVLRAFANHPVKFAAFALAANAFFGMDDKDEMLAPAHAKGSTNMFLLPDYFKIWDDGRHMKLFNFGRMVPGFRINPIDSFMNLISGETQVDTKLGYVGAIAQIVNGLGYKSQSPFAKNESFSFTAKVLDLAQEILPNYAVKLPRDAYKAYTGQIDKNSGEIVTPSDVVINYLGGKIITVDKAQAFDILKDSAKNRIKGDIKKVAYGDISIGELKKSVTYVTDKMKPFGLEYNFSDATLKQLVNIEIQRQASLTLQNDNLPKNEKEIKIKKLKESLQKNNQ